MEEITERCASIKLSSREDAEVTINEPVPEDGLVLIGKFFTKRRVNLEFMTRVLKTVWKIEKTFEASDRGENKIMFLFQTKDDMNRVLFLCPWSFDKYLLVLHKLERGEAVKDIKFDWSPFWLQIHGLPTMCQTKTVGLSIGATLGEVEKVDANEKGFCLGKFIQIRVLLDISIPLCRGRKVRLGEYGLKWVDFKYERLLIFCYLCGRSEHDERDCLQGIRSKETLRPEEKRFGPWLRATQDKLQKPLVVTMERNEATKTREVGTESGEHGVGVIAEHTTASDNPRINHPGKVEWMEVPRTDKVKVHTLSSHIQVNIPKIPLSSNFEQQHRDIDAAISGEASDVITKPGKEVNLDRKEVSLNLNDARLEMKEFVPVA